MAPSVSTDPHVKFDHRAVGKRGYGGREQTGLVAVGHLDLDEGAALKRTLAIKELGPSRPLARR